MFKKLVKPLLALTAMSCLITGSVHADDEFPNMPKEAHSANGVVTIYLPNSSWKEVKYDGACAAFSNGSDFILFEHYAKGEPVKDIEVGAENELYYETIQTAKDVKLVFYGYADDQESLDEIKTAVGNASVDVSKLPAEEKHEIVKDQYSIEANDFTGYVVASELNVRSENGLDAEPVGGLVYGDEVHVKGNVLLNGVFNGWYQIDFNGGNGYVTADYISTVKPEPQPTPQPVVNVSVVRADGTDEGTHFLHKEDGGWVDNYGDAFMDNGDGETWTRSSDGTLWTSGELPIKPVLNVSVVRADGTDEGTHFLHEEGGSWIDDAGDAFMDNGDGETWTRSSDGTLWTSGELPITPVLNISVTRADGTDEGTHFLHEEGGGWVDDEGEVFTDNGDGETWTRSTDGTLWTE